MELLARQVADYLERKGAEDAFVKAKSDFAHS